MLQHVLIHFKSLTSRDTKSCATTGKTYQTYIYHKNKGKDNLSNQPDTRLCLKVRRLRTQSGQKGQSSPTGHTDHRPDVATLGPTTHYQQTSWGGDRSHCSPLHAPHNSPNCLVFPIINTQPLWLSITWEARTPSGYDLLEEELTLTQELKNKHVRAVVRQKLADKHHVSSVYATQLSPDCQISWQSETN